MPERFASKTTIPKSWSNSKACTNIMKPEEMLKVSVGPFCSRIAAIAYSNIIVDLSVSRTQVFLLQTSRMLTTIIILILKQQFRAVVYT